MNQRIYNLSKWIRIEDGGSLAFDAEKPRTVILEVNCPADCWFYVAQSVGTLDDDEERLTDRAAGRAVRAENAPQAFLGLARGRDRFEFAVSGPFSVSVEGSEAYVYTVDGMDTATRVEAPEVFTRIANRRQRNPHLEMMEYQMRINVERRLAELNEEAERRVKALEEKLESYAPQRDQRAPAHRTLEAFRRPSDGEATGDEPAGAEPVSEAAVEDRPAGKKRKDKEWTDDE